MPRPQRVGAHEADMANNKSGFYRSESLCYKGEGPQDRDSITSAQAVETSSHQNPHAQPEGLGNPPMGWMPRKNVIAIVRKIDAELSRLKGG